MALHCHPRVIVPTRLDTSFINIKKKINLFSKINHSVKMCINYHFVIVWIDSVCHAFNVVRIEGYD